MKMEMEFQNMSTALYYYQLSANQGNPRALGYLYDTGKGVEKNLQKAYEFYQQAGYQGYSIAHYNLGNCFYWGNGVSKNLATARYYYLLAAQEGDKDVKDMLLRLPRDETKTAFY
jgi:TPR repeat protein